MCSNNIWAGTKGNCIVPGCTQPLAQAPEVENPNLDGNLRAALREEVVGTSSFHINHMGRSKELLNNY